MSSVKKISTSSSLIQAPTHTQTKIDLTPWDLHTLLIHYNQRGLLYHKPEKHIHSFDAIVNHLKTSLSRTLVFFPLLAGRLVTSKNDREQSFFIDCNNEGALFRHTRIQDLKVSDIVEPEYVPEAILSRFFLLNGVCNFEGTSNPLLSVQVTELDDGYFIGCSLNHSVADGTSFWHFVNSWSEISRGTDSPTKIPVFERWFPQGVSRPINVPLIDDEVLVHDPSSTILLFDRFFHFSRENIERLKWKASSGLESNQVSSLQAVLAHIWRSVTRCRGLDENEETAMKIPAGARQRMEPPLPASYFGNSVSPTGVTAAAGDLLSCDGLRWAAAQLNRVVASLNSEETNNFYENWPRQPRLLRNAEPEMRNNFLVVSSSQRFDIYGNDFGWGKPVAVRTGPNNKYDGKMAIFAGVEEGSMDIELSLTKDTLQAMEMDVEFMEFVGI